MLVSGCNADATRRCSKSHARRGRLRRCGATICRDLGTRLMCLVRRRARQRSARSAWETGTAAAWPRADERKGPLLAPVGGAVTPALFLAAAGLDALALTRAVPPACLRGVDPAPVTARDGADTLLMLPTWTPRRPAVHLLPSFAPLTDAPLAFRFEVSALADGEWSSWAASATIGAADFAAPASPTTPLTCD